jgi:exosome complex RNA-binding protein Csl4
MSITPQQEKFAQAVASGMNQSDAYREAYKVKPTTKTESVNQNASRLMANVNIASRVDELRAPIVKAAQLTLEAHLNDLKGLRNMATKAEQYSAAISAEVARGKAAGLYVDNVKATVLTRTLEPLKDDDFLG